MPQFEWRTRPELIALVTGQRRGAGTQVDIDQFFAKPVRGQGPAFGCRRGRKVALLFIGAGKDHGAELLQRILVFLAPRVLAVESRIEQNERPPCLPKIEPERA